MEYFDIRTLFNDNIKKILKTNTIFLDSEDKFKKKFFESICESTNNKIPKSIAEMIIKENNNPDYTILIHRSSRVSKEELFKNGLLIAGGNDLDYTTSRYDNDNITLLYSIANASGYKNTNANDSICAIIKIPNTALKYTDGKTKPILLPTDNIAEQGGGMAVVKGHNQTYLLPEYILGVIKYRDFNITGFEKNPNYTEIHNYKNNGLVYPQETINSYRNKIQNKNNLITEKNIKQFTANQKIPFSKFNQMSKKIKDFFTNIKDKGGNFKNVDR